MSLLVKWPTRSRPDLFRERLRLYQRDPTARFLITIDQDDPTMVSPGMLNFLDEQPNLKYRIGNSKGKIEAVNDGLDVEPWNGICLVASDDMVPQCDDYARKIVAIFRHCFPKGDGVLHLNDGRTGDHLNTIPIFDRRWYERFRYAYNPQYISLFADNELMEVSRMLDRAAYVDECLIRHCWIGDERPDELHRFNESFHDQDERTFRRRKAAGFPA